MEDYRISDWQITASSTDHNTLAPWCGRLNVVRGNGAWEPLNRVKGEWLQIDLLKTTVLVKVATQGRAKAVVYVTSYWLQYSINGENWTEYTINGVKKVFLKTNKQIKLMRIKTRKA